MSKWRRAASAACITGLLTLGVLGLVVHTAGGDDESSSTLLKVSVLGPGGVPVANAKILYYGKGPSINQRRWARDGLPITTSDVLFPMPPTRTITPGEVDLARGKADLRLPAGLDTLWIEVHHAQKNAVTGRMLAATVVGPLTIAAKKDGPVIVRLDGGRTVRGTLRFPEGSTGADGARVVAYARRPYMESTFPLLSWWPHAESDVGDDGAYELRGLGGFDYIFEYLVPMAWAMPEPVVLDSVSFDGGGQGAMQLPPIEIVKSITGLVVVRDSHGNGVRHAHVRPFWAGPTGYSRDVRHGQGAAYPLLQEMYFITNAEGRVEIAGLNPNREYSLWVLPPEDRMSQWIPARLKGWRPHDGVAHVALH